MVQKRPARPGRPREYDPETALQRATDAFWDAGFSGTSLDDLSARTGMNRPSLYAAFGDKQALYLQTLETYRAERRTLITTVLRADRRLRETLRALYRGMAEFFLSGDRGARGCYMVGTAATEAVLDEQVREVLAGGWSDLDEAFATAFAAARARGEMGSQADPKALALMATAVVHTLALRARAGERREALQAVADSAVDLLCSAGRPPPKRRR